MVVAKNGRGLLGLATLKSAVYQEWIDGMSLFLYTDTDIGKLKLL